MQITIPHLMHNVLSELFFFFGRGADLLRRKNVSPYKILYYRKKMKKHWEKNPGFSDRRRDAIKESIPV